MESERKGKMRKQTNKPWRNSEMKKDVYQIITDAVVKSLKEGIVPWHQPWMGNGRPANLISRKAYRGINAWILNLISIDKGYNHNLFLTFRQANNLGAKVRKGEHGYMVVFWKWLEVANKDYNPDNPLCEEKPTKKIPLFRYYKVFNVDQCEGIPEEKLPRVDKMENFNQIDIAEEIVGKYSDHPEIIHNGTSAQYNPQTDQVHMPAKTRFESEPMYYITLFHELTHSTGAVSRLNRKEVAQRNGWDMHEVSIEELVAELGAAYLGAEAGIQGTIEHNAAYIKHWLGVLRDEKNKRWLPIAASRAQKATDYILGNEIQIENNENQ